MPLLALVATLALQEPLAQPASAELHVDLALVRELGWVPADASPEAALAAAAARARREAGRALADLRAEDANGEPRLHLTFAEGLGSDERRVITGWLESIGTCRFFLVLHDERAKKLGIDLAAERAKLAAWVAEHAEQPLAAFNSLPADTHGPCAGLMWLVNRQHPGLPARSELERALPLEIPSADEAFCARQFVEVSASTDDLGMPAIGFVLEPARADLFGAFTERIRGHQLAILVGELVWSAPTVEDRLPGQGIVRGYESDAERDATLADLRKPAVGVFRAVESR